MVGSQRDARARSGHACTIPSRPRRLRVGFVANIRRRSHDIIEGSCRMRTSRTGEHARAIRRRRRRGLLIQMRTSSDQGVQRERDRLPRRLDGWHGVFRTCRPPLLRAAVRRSSVKRQRFSDGARCRSIRRVRELARALRRPADYGAGREVRDRLRSNAAVVIASGSNTCRRVTSSASSVLLRAVVSDPVLQGFAVPSKSGLYEDLRDRI